MAVDVAQLQISEPNTQARSLFISTPAKDLFFYFASVTVVLIAWFAATVMHVSGFYILATVAVVANGPHLVSTWTRVYFDRREWRERPLLIIGMPLAIATTVLLIVTFLGQTGSRILNSTILYWATWHFVAQNWGIMRIYQRKSGEPLTSIAMRLERPILYLIVAWCLLYRLYTGPRVLFGTEIYWVPLPGPVVHGLLGPLAFLVAVYLVQRIRERHQPWARAAWLRTAFLVCAFVGFFVPFELIKTDDTSAFAAAACWHGIQYLGIMRFYHRNTWRGGVHPDAKIISWLSQPGKARLALYAALLLALAGSGYVLIATLTFLSSHLSLPKGAATPLVVGAGVFVFSQVVLLLLTRKQKVPWLTFGRLALFVPPLIVASGKLGEHTPVVWNEFTWAAVVWISFTLSHYWLDGVIWKLKQPEVARRVGI